MIYRIKKILNNNVVISENRKGQEIIITGNGIGFGVKPRSIISENKINRIYIPESREFANRFTTLLNGIPYECFEIAEKIKEMAEETLGEKLNQNLIVSLADHINFALTQFEKGSRRVALMNEEIKRYYPDEYKIGKKAVRMVADKFNIQWDDSEAFAFAFHIINSETGAKTDDATKIMCSIQEIIKIIEISANITLCEESLDYSRLIIHLKFFLKRVLTHSEYDNQFKNLLLNPNGDAFKGVTKSLDAIDEYMHEKFNHSLNDTERVYLLIHIARVLGI